MRLSTGIRFEFRGEVLCPAGKNVKDCGNGSLGMQFGVRDVNMVVCIVMP